MEIEIATAIPRSPVSCTIAARGHSMVQDKPASNGGEDSGPMASEFLLASLLSCQLSTFAKVAAKRKAEIRASKISGELHFDAASDISLVKLAWTIAGAANDSAITTVLRLTDKTCTISRLLKCPVEFTFTRT